MIRFFLMLLCFLAISGRAQIYKQSAKIIASDRDAGDLFGTSVDIDGNYAIVGAHSCDSINSIIECGVGAAYIYKKGNLGWNLIQRLSASDKEGDMWFGNSVSIDGNTAVVAAYREDANEFDSKDYGSVYVFNRDSITGHWVEKQKIISSSRNPSSEFGFSVKLHKGTLAISSHQRSFNYDLPNNILYGGSVYIYKQDTASVWQEFQEIVPNNSYYFQQFGHSIALSDSFLVVGVPNEDTVNGQFDRDVGAAYVYGIDTNGFYQYKQRLSPGVFNLNSGGEDFGYSVSVDETYILIGEPGRQGGGAASLFTQDSSGFFLFNKQFIEPQLQGSSAHAGRSVAISGNDFFVGAHGHDDPITYNSNQGCVYWYGEDTLVNGVTLRQVIYANDRQKGDNFGHSLAVDLDKLLVGAITEKHDLNGNNPLSMAGSAYLFDFGCYSDSIIVYRNNFNLFINPDSTASYQWVRCDLGFAAIPGATQPSYTVTQNGTYAVVRTWNGCVDTSYCREVIVSVSGEKEYLSFKEVYPNPTKDEVNLDLGFNLQDFVLNVYSLTGKNIESRPYKSVRHIKLDLSDYPLGIYYIEAQGSGFYFSEKVVKF